MVLGAILGKYTSGDDSEEKVLQSFRRIMKEEATALKQDAIETAMLALELHKIGDKTLAHKVMLEAISIAKSYLRVAQELGLEPKIRDAKDLIACLEVADEMILHGEDADIIMNSTLYYLE